MNKIKKQRLAKEKLLAQKQLKELLWYNPYTGLFFWNAHKEGGAKAGDVAGWIDSHGYRHIHVNGKTYYAHRLAWLYIKGVWPKDRIDHKNRVKHDNRFDNLREATQSQNAANSTKQKNNTSGYKGVSFRKDTPKYVAQIESNGKHKNLGSFDCPKEAYAAYCQAAKELHGDFASPE